MIGRTPGRTQVKCPSSAPDELEEEERKNKGKGDRNGQKRIGSKAQKNEEMKRWKPVPE